MAFGSSRDIKKLPNMQDILSCVSSEDIFCHYLGAIPAKPICSPLRKDKIPSFSIFYSSRYEMMMYKDFATGEVGNPFLFVKRLLNLEKLTDVFLVIARDMQLHQFETQPGQTGSRTSFVSSKNVRKGKKDRIVIKVKVRYWEKHDAQFWNGKYKFTKEMLEYCGIYPISHYFMNDYCREAEKHAYAFQERKDGVITYKIYQPFSEDNKWVNNNDFSTWELWTQLPDKGDNLIITSSRKDAMAIKSLFPSSYITSCALQSENVNPKPHIIDELKNRFKKIYVLYDNDSDNEKNPGRTAAMKLVKEYDFIKMLEIPTEYKIKDPSDFLEAHGQKKLRNLILKLKKDAN